MADQAARIEKILHQFPQIKRNALIPLLQAVQDEFGFISEEAVAKIGAHLSLPTSKVYGLATFYNQFSFSPRGFYHVVLCNGTSCHMGGAGDLLNEITKLLEIGDGETTRDGLFSLEVQSCIGACGQSPVMSVNGTYFSGISVKEVREIIKQYREDAER
ncbi:MAG: NAD(P)H-dependent oxidoreductase subunit E [Bacteroidales bacterium]|nr:NAD(P)H-dependent oxidoreductase subunit E [Bacteroidales bacterium]